MAKKLLKKLSSKGLALAVMAGVMAGGYGGSALAANYTEAFTGVAEGPYQNLVNEITGNFVFADATTIDVSNNGLAAINIPGYVNNKITLKMVVGEDLIEGQPLLHDLKLLNKNTQGEDAYGIRQTGMVPGWNETSLFINAKNIQVDVASEKGAYGLHFVEEDPNAFHLGHGNVLTADKVSINAQGGDGALGIYVGGGFNTIINGALDMTSTEGDWGIDGGADSSNFKTVGIRAGEGSSAAVRDNAKITVNGTGILADGKVELDKGGSITIKQSNDSINYAIAVQGGTVKFNQSNYSGDKPEKRAGEIYGNLGFIGPKGTMNIILGNGSVFQGVVVREDNTDGILNLTLSGNNSKWVNEAYGLTSEAFKGTVVDSFTGGATAGDAPYIYQKDSNPLTFNKYSGHAVVIYDHSGSGTSSSDYAAGDTIVQSAAPDSVVTLSTGNNGINMEDTLEVDKVLNALASKIVYAGITNEQNLSGKVQIADGLTGSEASKRIEDIVFDETGRGGYGSIQKAVSFDQGITGIESQDQVYKNAGVLGGGIYQFQKSSTITVADAPALDVQKLVTIDAGKTTLTLSSTNSAEGAVSQKIAGTSTITAGNVQLISSSDGRAKGLFLQGGAEGQATMNINGNLHVLLDSAPDVVGEGIGIHTSGAAELNINGDVSVKRDTTKVAPRYGYFATSGIYAGGDKEIHKGSHVQISGNVDLEGGLYANMFGSSITVQGGGQIIADDTGKIESMAITAQSGTISINMDANTKEAGDKDLVIAGNILLNNGLNAQHETTKTSEVNLGLNTAQSSLTGVVINNVSVEGYSGTTNMVLANGAQWNHSVYGRLDYELSSQDSTVENFVGGADENKRGVIRQSAAGDINLNQYSGNTLVIYEHQNQGTQRTDYQAGDVIVHKAAEGSVITVSTDNSGIDLNNLSQVNKVLEALAGKLTYLGYVSGEENLTGKVQIADGLTGSSKAMRLKDITFDTVTGQGHYEKPDDSVVVTHNMQLIEDNYQGSTQRDYYKDNYISNGNRGYTFDSNTVIDVQIDRDPYDESTHSLPRGVIAWAGGDGSPGDGDGYIDMTGHRLTLNGTAGPDFNKRPTGIFVASDTLTIKNVKGLDININNSLRDNGMMVQGFISHGAWNNGSGHAKLVIENGMTMDEAVKIRFNNCGDIQSAIKVYDNSGSATLDIKGMVDIFVGLENATGIENFDGDVSIGGGKIVSKASYSIKNGGYNSHANTLINMEKNSEGHYQAMDNNRYVELEGNILMSQNADLAIGFTSSDSKFTGGVKVLPGRDSNINEDNKEETITLASGQAHLLFANGATWINQTNMDKDWTGSRVAELMGGKNEDSRGILLQKDGKDLVVDKYSGQMLVIYEHTNQGTQAADYQAGNLIIKTAAPKAGITLSTDNTGIDTSDSAVVEQVLNTLAGKLYYEAYTNGESNLNGKVQIADGLTGSSASLAVGNIQFSETNGQGSYVPEIKAVYDKAITGTAKDQATYGEAYKGNGLYEFAAGGNITINNGLTADIAPEADITINAQGSTLNLESVGDDFMHPATNIEIKKSGLQAVVNANTINLNAVHSDYMGGANAINVAGGSSAAALELNGDVNITAKGGANAAGIRVKDSGQVTINGGLTVKAQADGAYDAYNPTNTTSFGILADDNNYANPNKVTVNGDTNLQIKGHGVFAKTGEINLEGNVNIGIEKQAAGIFNAIVAEGIFGNATVNINSANSAANDIIINGNLSTYKDFGSGSGTINLNMNNKNSVWTGIADTGEKNGNINLALANGATWVNESYGNQRESVLNGPYGSTITSFAGSASEAGMGAIVQKHASDLTINNYSGYTTVIYEHKTNGETTEDYIGGNTIIKNAKADSGIIISTDSSNITLSDEEQTNKVLNALAGKLYYAGYVSGERNLSGKVQIADGLTSSSAGKVIGDITFAEADGKGSYLPPEKPVVPEHQTQVDFTTSITGRADKDTEYLYGGVLKEDGSYLFEKDSNITITDSMNGINVREDVVVKAAGSTLNLKVEGGNDNTLAGINQTSKNKAEITADQINIDVVNTVDRAEGISIMGTDSKNITGLDINGNLNITAKGNGGNGYALGIYAAGNSRLTINGDITMKGKDGDWGVQNDEHFDFMQTVGIYAGPNYNIQKGAIINVNGNVDLKVKGTGVMANGGNSQVYLNNGNVTIETNQEATTPDYAVISASGIVDINMKNSTSAGTNTVIIKGNVGTDAASVHEDEVMKESIVNIGLSNAQSLLHGVIVNNFTPSVEEMGFTGATNLYLANGATWINEAYGRTENSFEGSEVEKLVGGNSYASSGIIKHIDYNDMTINNYSGHTIIVYEHTGDGSDYADYEAGNTIIRHAAAGSEIVMYTNNDGIEMSDTAQVDKVLNTLANKLIYEGFVEGETNLTGTVTVADGLTSSTVSRSENITFDQESGVGGYVPEAIEPEHQNKVDFTTAITGGEDVEYKEANVLKEQGQYVFEKDSNITLKADKSGAIDVRSKVTIDAQDSTLNLNNEVTGFGTAYGIKHETANKLEINAQKLNINVKAQDEEGIKGIGMKGKAEAVINGTVALNTQAAEKSMPTYKNYGAYVQDDAKLTINGNVNMQGAEGAWGVNGGDAYGLYANGGNITVNGNVNMSINGNGIHAEQGTISVQGGFIKINKEGTLDEMGMGDYALKAANGVINVNMNEDGSAANHKVNILGNVGVTDNFLGHGTINLALTTADSTLTGVFHKQTALPFSLAPVADTASINLTLANGATWTNEIYGVISSDFAGSVVDNLVGGKDKAGVIIQKDSHDLTINNFDGKAMVIYEHNGDGSRAEDFGAGATVIKQAAEGSSIVMSTDNTGINMDDMAAVETVLNNLADKLVYEAHDTNTNLTGKVQIADGLTGSSVSKQAGDISFGEDGHGQYVEGSLQPGAGGDIDYGDYENNIMKGTRSAMMTAMLAWRDVAGDFTNRTSELRAGLENGAWARIYGGKTEYDGTNTAFESSYGAVQFGYDQEVGRNWNAGIAVDYQDGDADYVMGGTGDHKLYSIGAYASRDMGTSGYVDLSAKLGRVENEFTASNGLGLTADGKYQAESYSLSAQYGKRFGEATTGYLEPQVQLTWARMGGDSFTAVASNGQELKVSQNAFESLVGRVALQAGKATARGGFFARLGLAHEFMGDVDGTYNAEDGGLKNTSFDLGETWSELTLGMNYNLNANSNLFLDLTKGLSGDYRQEWKANLGYRFTF